MERRPLLAPSSGGASEDPPLTQAAGQRGQIADLSVCTALIRPRMRNMKYKEKKNYITAADEELNGRCWDGPDRDLDEPE